MNPHDTQALALIEEALAEADPQFAARLSAFSRLTDGAMPDRERIREGRRPTMRPVLRGPRPGRQVPRRLMYWIAVAVAVSITLAVVCSALVIGRTGTKGACSGWQAGNCGRQAAPSAPGPSGQGGVPSLGP